MNKKILLVGFLVLLSASVIGCGNKAAGNIVADTGDADSEGYIRVPLSSVSEKVQFYDYDDDGVNIRYFAVLGSDGQPRTAFDACDVCGGYQGYEQQGEDISCRKCGRVFSIDGLGTKNKGYGCWPGYLPHTIEGKDLLIDIEDIKKGKNRFV